MVSLDSLLPSESSMQGKGIDNFDVRTSCDCNSGVHCESPLRFNRTGGFVSFGGQIRRQRGWIQRSKARFLWSSSYFVRL